MHSHLLQMVCFFFQAVSQRFHFFLVFGKSFLNCFQQTKPSFLIVCLAILSAQVAGFKSSPPNTSAGSFIYWVKLYYGIKIVVKLYRHNAMHNYDNQGLLKQAEA
jgi:hypothetical protein